jgi:hypothetical protein
MKRPVTWISALLCAAVLGVMPRAASAQEPTTTKTQAVHHFEVVAVKGNTVTVKTGGAKAEDITVDENYRFTVDGQQVSVHDLKPGMKGTATITTSTTVTPVVVTEVHNGRVMQANGNSIVVQTNNGFRMFTEQDVNRRGATIVRNGQPVDFTSLRTGDMLTATVVTEHPPKVVTKREVDAQMASPAAPASTAPTTAATAGGTASTGRTHANAARSSAAPEGGAAAETPHKKLPKTASPFPAIGALGALLCGLALMLGVIRRRLA